MSRTRIARWSKVSCRSNEAFSLRYPGGRPPAALGRRARISVAGTGRPLGRAWVLPDLGEGVARVQVAGHVQDTEEAAVDLQRTPPGVEAEHAAAGVDDLRIGLLAGRAELGQRGLRVLPEPAEVGVGQ